MGCTLTVIPLHHWSRIPNKSMHGPWVMLQTKHSCPETLFSPGRQAHKLSSSLKAGSHFLRTQCGKPISSRKTVANVSRQWSHFHMEAKFILFGSKALCLPLRHPLDFFFKCKAFPTQTVVILMLMISVILASIWHMGIVQTNTFQITSVS